MSNPSGSNAPSGPSGSEARIVVGFDGSEGSQPALAWAIREAQLRHYRLDVVRAWTPGEFGTDDDIATYTLEHLEKEVAEAVGGTPVSWHAYADKGGAAKVLTARAAGAEMLVVGSRGHGALTNLLLGSVSTHVSTHVGAPVVVIVRSSDESAA